MTAKSAQKAHRKAVVQATKVAIYGKRAHQYRNISDIDLLPFDGIVPRYPSIVAKLTDEQLLEIGWTPEQVAAFRLANGVAEAKWSRRQVELAEAPPRRKDPRAASILSMALAMGGLGLGGRR